MMRNSVVFRVGVRIIQPIIGGMINDFAQAVNIRHDILRGFVREGEEHDIAVFGDRFMIGVRHHQIEMRQMRMDFADLCILFHARGEVCDVHLRMCK